MNNCSVVVAIVMMIAVLNVCCSRSRLQPVPVENDDICDNCQMTILDPEFAAEALMDDGDVKKFDTPICMVQRFSGPRNKLLKSHIKGLFVTDFNSRRWVNAESALYVRGDIRTPVMGYNLLVMSDSNLVKSFCREHHCDGIMDFRGFWLRYAEPDLYISLSLNDSDSKSIPTFMCNLNDIVQVKVKNERGISNAVLINGYERVHICVQGSSAAMDRFYADRPGDFFDIIDSTSGKRVGRLIVRGAHLHEEERQYYEW
ncbi:MAG: nitrous oxide reductase accessory protein NosL [Candidatus Kryptoniota bacterium]